MLSSLAHPLNYWLSSNDLIAAISLVRCTLDYNDYNGKNFLPTSPRLRQKFLNAISSSSLSKRVATEVKASPQLSVKQTDFALRASIFFADPSSSYLQSNHVAIANSYQ